jgi:HEAT repeats
MAHESNCSFCETLPGTPKAGWGGTSSKCPMCKQELWVSQSGGTYRLGAAAPPSALGKWCCVASLSAVAGGLVVALGVWANWPTPQPNIGTASAPIVPTSPTGKKMTVPDGPVVRAKPGPSVSTARAKPLPPPAPKLVAKPPVVVEPTPEPVPTPALVVSQAPISAEALEAQLRDIPEADYDPDYLKRSKEDIAKQAKDILAATKNDHDVFVRNLMKDRSDLAGLPFLMGKDCSLDKEKRTALAQHSTEIRRALDAVAEYRKKLSKNQSYYPKSDLDAEHFWRPNRSVRSEAIPAMRQIILAQGTGFRLGFVYALNENDDTRATDALVNRAVFDLDHEVRQAAVVQLRYRPKTDYVPALKNALRYPWAPVVRHASEAIAKLELNEMVPDLVAMLDEPDPAAPFVVEGENGEEKMFVHELVRINHHRNCMLCHAPLDASKLDRQELRTMPVGPAPSPKEALPPISSTVYYLPKSGNTLVRADVTYLRQDFSLQQNVENPGKWPEMQRFDFLVRTRELTGMEFAKRPPADSDYMETIGQALQALTGRNAPPNAAAWRAALDQPKR